MKLNELYLTEAPRWPTTKEQVEAQVYKHCILDEEYVINDDLTVSTEGQVRVGWKNTGSFAGRIVNYGGQNLPVKFRHVGGSFVLDGCTKLISLEGMPISVGEDVSIVTCHNLRTLEHFPPNIGEALAIRNCNKIESLIGLPAKIPSDLTLFNLKSLKSFEGAPREIGGDVALDGFTSLVGISAFIQKISGSCGIEFKKLSDIVEGGIELILIADLQQFNWSDRKTKNVKAFDIIHEYLGRPDDIFACQAELIDAGFEQYAKL